MAGIVYLQVLRDNLKNQKKVSGEEVKKNSIEILKNVCGDKDLMLHSREKHYMTLFTNVDAEYIFNFLVEENQFELVDENSEPGLKHMEQSGDGVSIIIGDDIYFLFPTEQMTVDCKDGYYDEVPKNV